jgi:hypothetical protein
MMSGLSFIILVSLLLERVSIVFVIIIIIVCVITSEWATVLVFADFACINCLVGQKPGCEPSIHRRPSGPWRLVSLIP